MSILVTTTHLALSQNILTATVAHPASTSEGTVSPFPRVHWQGRETDRSLKSCADIVNVWSNHSTLPVPSRFVERENVPYCCCLCNSLHCSKQDMDVCLSGGRESSVGRVTRYGMEDPGFQPQWWQNKHCQSTFSSISVLKHCKNITW